MDSGRIPVTILAGFLGAGKTTLLNRILSGDHGRRYAVIVNEFGAIGIDGSLVVGATEELVEMSNGCVCCTVRGDLVRTVHELLPRLRGPNAVDGLIVETTGLANPGPVAQTFFVDPVLQAATSLDAIVTVIDARHIGRQLKDMREAAEQVAFGDVLVLNQADLASEAEVDAVELRLRLLNPLAPIHRTSRGAVELGAILRRGSFDLARLAGLESAFEPAHVHDEHCGHDLAHAERDHVAEAGIAAVCIELQQPVERETFAAWLQGVVARDGADILRLKGIVDVAGDPRRLVVQGVHTLLEGEPGRAWGAGETRSTRLVLIGRRLDARALEEGLKRCSASAASPSIAGYYQAGSD